MAYKSSGQDLKKIAFKEQSWLGLITIEVFSADYAQKHLLEKLEKEIKAHPEKYSSKNKDKSDTEDCMLNSVNLVKLIKSEIASTDKDLIKEALSRRSTSGTTALLVLQNEEFLVVGNVGDSRGVMCCNNSDGSMTSIPLSYDHKPDQLKEKKRIEEAGGWVLFNGVWRVLGILAVSRAMGDTLFKDRNLVISDPDVLCFPLRGSSDPKFYILDNVSVLSVLLPDLGNKKRVVDRRQSVNSPSLGRKQRPARRVVSFEEMERRMMTLEGKSKPEKIEEKVTES
ncbi:unnamed protein product [Notodromas monacha]|uniref:PPM-type phosphatase domain-containing protein n=1 Tax=Notodromas monacha TaxID=399045 RepID=A0A7R9BXU3_9CRUS|nr:unnamed protein product [Notodromas monacha]CAG0923790.1 unnamed protein product [Notodromas monacha]